MMNYVLSPSILAADFKVLGQEMKKTEENGAAYIHFDVMDGMRQGRSGHCKDRMRIRYQS